MKKIDIHCHTTNREVEGIIPKSATLNNVLEEMKRHEIERTVLLATYFPHKTSGISNFRLLRWLEGMKGKKQFYMFGSLDFEHYFFQGLNELEELADSSLIKGIKVYTCYQNIGLKSKKFDTLMGLAEKYALPMMFHCGYSYSSYRIHGIASVTKMVKAGNLEFLAKEKPQINFILSHMAKPFFSDLINVVKRNNNIYSDTSGLIDSKFRRNEIGKNIAWIKKFLYECGPYKLLFGTDFPVQTHNDSVSFIEHSMKNFTSDDKQNVYYNNAWRLLNNGKK